jgi:hypothetical protein
MSVCVCASALLLHSDNRLLGTLNLYAVSSSSFHEGAVRGRVWVHSGGEPTCAAIASCSMDREQPRTMVVAVVNAHTTRLIPPSTKPIALMHPPGPTCSSYRERGRVSCSVLTAGGMSPEWVAYLNDGVVIRVEDLADDHHATAHHDVAHVLVHRVLQARPPNVIRLLRLVAIAHTGPLGVGVHTWEMSDRWLPYTPTYSMELRWSSTRSGSVASSQQRLAIPAGVRASLTARIARSMLPTIGCPCTRPS